MNTTLNLEEVRLYLTEHLIKILETLLVSNTEKSITNALLLQLINEETPNQNKIITESLRTIGEHEIQEGNASKIALKELALRFFDMLRQTESTVIEYHLIKKQESILEKVIYAYEHLIEWDSFITEILNDFQSEFPGVGFIFINKEENTHRAVLYTMKNLQEKNKIIYNKLIDSLIKTIKISDNTLSSSNWLELENPIDNGKPIKITTQIISAIPRQDRSSIIYTIAMCYLTENPISSQEKRVIKNLLDTLLIVSNLSLSLNKSYKQLEFYSNHDPLTGLHNRRYFNSILEYELARSIRHNSSFAVLSIDLDNFKKINDTFGHLCGDNVLKALANGIQDITRKGDVVARVGGDEFSVILSETHLNQSIELAEKFRKRIAQIDYKDGRNQPIKVTVSIGVAGYPESAKDIMNLLKKADVALYQAKQSGRNEVRLFEAENAEAVKQIPDFSKILEAALARDEIYANVNTIMNCITGDVQGYEFWFNLRLPDGHSIPLPSIQSEIEKSDVSEKIFAKCIIKAFENYNKLNKAAAIKAKLFIPISINDLYKESRVNFIKQQIVFNTLGKDIIILSLNERDIIKDPLKFNHYVSGFKALGCAFSIDNFGSSYNSFHYLKSLLLEYIKISDDLIQNFLYSKIDYMLVKNIISLCRDLNIKSISQDVDSEDKLTELKKMGINFIQSRSSEVACV